MLNTIMSSVTHSLVIRELVDNAHQPLDPNMTDREPHMGVASLAEQEIEGKVARNDKVSITHPKQPTCLP